LVRLIDGFILLNLTYRVFICVPLRGLSPTQRENSKFTDFNDPTQVWRRPCKKHLQISTNDLYCQKL